MGDMDKAQESSWPPLSVVIAGGGTGGHLFPGIAVANAFVARNSKSRILFVGSGRPLEKEALHRAGFERSTIHVEGIKGRGMMAKLRAFCKIPSALMRSSGILSEARAQIVVAVGGYAAGPVALAAWLKRITLVVCEQNTVPGITNRLLFPLARRIYVSFEDTIGRIDPNKIRFFGNPVRQQILKLRETDTKRRETFTVMIVGGSQGAHAINIAVMDALSHLATPERLSFIHQTGEADQDAVARAYADAGIDAQVKAFFHDMASRYKQADLVVCRAGATTVAELTVLGKAALFVPFPFAADDHQVTNARALVDRGAALMIPERDLSGEILAETIERFAGNPELLFEMAARSRRLGKPEAAQFIVDDCYRLVKGESCI